ncbi:MAG: ribonuclease III [Acidobacteriota bacterium]
MTLKRRIPTALEERLGYRFQRPRLLETAVTHRSFANEKGLDRNYERLEFLGDAILGMIAAEWLFSRYPDEDEGELSKLKSSLVSARSLARFAGVLGLGESLRLGVGEERSGGRRKRSLLADSLEAVFGAVYRDGGIDAARSVILPMLESAPVSRRRGSAADAKTDLQEFAQGRGWDLPEYHLLSTEGPDHDKTFTFQCWVDGRVVGQGTGSSKKRAEQAAAAEALEALAEEE